MTSPQKRVRYGESEKLDWRWIGANLSGGNGISPSVTGVWFGACDIFWISSDTFTGNRSCWRFSSYVHPQDFSKSQVLKQAVPKERASNVSPKWPRPTSLWLRRHIRGMWREEKNLNMRGTVAPTRECDRNGRRHYGFLSESERTLNGGRGIRFRQFFEACLGV